jgi:hypothetical protein
MDSQFKQAALETLDKILQDATCALEPDYFQLPVAGLENPQYRERVYCYELYHLIRARWPADFRFSLAGEIDKAGHPLIRGNGLDYAKPDFIVHVPGDMDFNILVLEVKGFTLDRGRLANDLEKLTAFRRHARYHAACYLFYGVPPDAEGALTTLCCDIAHDNPAVDLTLIQLLIHDKPGHPVGKRPWQ